MTIRAEFNNLCLNISKKMKDLYLIEWIIVLISLTTNHKEIFHNWIPRNNRNYFLTMFLQYRLTEKRNQIYQLN